jgi:hypothetical protein
MVSAFMPRDPEAQSQHPRLAKSFLDSTRRRRHVGLWGKSGPGSDAPQDRKMKALGLIVPLSLLGRADELIE